MPHDAGVGAGRLRFRLVHTGTGLTLGEYNMRRLPLHYYTPAGAERTDGDFVHFALRPVLRADGAIGFQRLGPGEGELYFLPGNEWMIEWKE